MLGSQASRPGSPFSDHLGNRAAQFPRDIAAPSWLACARLASFALLLSSVSLAQAAQRPFLPAVGPVPLRFADAIPAGQARYPLPPLDMGWPTPTNTVEVATQPANPSPSDPAATAEPSLDLGENPFAGLPAPTPATRRSAVNETVTYIAPEPALVQPLTIEPDSVYPPELLRILRNNNPGNTITGYFNAQRPTNGTVVIAPLGFEPPQPAVSPSSSATYEVVPTDSK